MKAEYHTGMMKTRSLVPTPAHVHTSGGLRIGKQVVLPCKLKSFDHNKTSVAGAIQIMPNHSIYCQKAFDTSSI